MKKLFFAIIAISYISACHSPYVDEPRVPGGGAVESRSGGAPGNITATQGGKRSIELSWDEVSGAVRYNIFKADSPLVPFAQCAETKETRFNFSVPAGSTVYYRVSAVAYNGQESARSFYVMGSSLAQPIITDITDITEASATVTWYMENVSDATYRANLRYTVYCFDKADGTEVAQFAIDGSRLTQNRAQFNDLLAGKEYAYQVEAYLVYDQSNSEKSEIMDRETARRFVPGAPEKLTASRGTSKDKIELSFELPEMVNIALGAGEYEMHGIYFVISKRFYSENGNDEYQKVCAYFGADASKAASPADTFESYEFGKTVTWTDTSASRGVKYEYLVQSYVDGTLRTITSDTSRAEVTGWTLAGASVSIGKPVYTPNESRTLYVSAEVPLNFIFNPMGEEYRYVVTESVEPIEDQGDLPLNERLDPDTLFRRESDYLNFDQMKSYTAKMDLTRKSMSSSPGRGLYSFKVVISLPGGEDIDTVTAIGDVLVSEDVAPIVVEGFAVEDGYTDKFRIKWDSAPNRKYILFSSTDKTTWEEVMTYNDPPSNDESERAAPRIEPLTGYDPGVTVYFAMQPVRVVTDDFNPVDKKGQRVYLAEGAQTLGVPELQPVTGHSYSTITATWTEAQKADHYRVKYRYTGESGWTPLEPPLSSSDLSPDVTGKLRYSFRPNGYDNPARSGREIEIAVEALNKELQTKIGGGEIATTSAETVKTRLVGPAELAAQVSKAASAEYIELSWNRVAGAGGYYVFRRQFNMDNTAEERGAVVYYIPAQEADIIIVTGKDMTTDVEGTKVDTPVVKATASFAASRYTLKDEYMIDHEYSGGFARHIQDYRDQQNELAWGCPYRYFIVPVLSNEPLSSINFTYAKNNLNKNTNITSYTLRENAVTINYASGAAALEQTGFTIGFGVEVTASKGTKSESGQVEISWKAPPLLAGAGFTPQYIVFRKRNSKSESDSPDTTWRPVSDSINITSYTDRPQERGIAYDYAVGIYLNGDAETVLPPISPRFIRIAKERYLDEKERPQLIGFTLASVAMIQVSRSQFDEEGVELKDAQGNFLEKVEWYAGGIDGADSYKGNLYDNNWGIDGYEIYVMNRNIDAQWHKIAEIPNPPNNTNQNVLVSNVQGGATLESGLLKVLRDYKHYYKVRSYVINEQYEKVLCPDPYWNYETLFVANRNDQETSNFLETDYVKWGARQITVEEFARIATLPIAWGIHHMRGGSRWNWVVHGYGEKTLNGNNGSGGTVSSEATYAASRWWWNFYNYKPSMDTRANKHPNGFQSGFYGAGSGGWTWQYAVIFLTINTGSRDGRSMIYAGAPSTSNFPDRYGARDNYGVDPFDIIGPPNVNGMYTGKMRFDNYQLNSSSQTAGSMRVRYPASAAEVQGVGQYNVALPYVVFQSDDQPIRFERDEWF